MGTITINIDEKTEKRFRENVKRKYGKKKGSLGAAVAEALNKWNNEQADFEFTLQLLDNATDRGGYQYESRDELHSRR